MNQTQNCDLRLLKAKALILLSFILLATLDTQHEIRAENTYSSESSKFPLRLGKHKHYFLDNTGQPFLLHGDTAWSLIGDLNREAVELYLADRQKRGFNAILVNLLEHQFSRNAPRNAYGTAPFLKDNDFSQPNEEYFQHADWVIQRASHYGLLVFLVPAYLGYEGGDHGWYRVMKDNGENKLQQYGEFIGKRYRIFDNIIWVNAGDFNPPEKWVVNTIAYAIRQHDPSALHTAHCGPETIASTYWTNEDWLDFDTLYTYLPVHIQARETYKSFKKTPTILFESAYEFEHSADEHRIRMQAYQALLTGASGHFFGNNPIWHFDGPGTFQSDINWREALNSRGTQSMTHLVNIFRRLEWWKLIPDLDGTLITDDRGADETYTVGAISNDGKFSMIYIPDERNLKLDLTGMKGPNIEQRWYDPSLGAFVDMKRIDKLTRSKHEVVTPGKNHVGDTDWILLLESTEH